MDVFRHTQGQSLGPVRSRQGRSLPVDRGTDVKGIFGVREQVGKCSAGSCDSFLYIPAGGICFGKADLILLFQHIEFPSFAGHAPHALLTGEGKPEGNFPGRERENGNGPGSSVNGQTAGPLVRSIKATENYACCARRAGKRRRRAGRCSGRDVGRTGLRPQKRAVFCCPGSGKYGILNKSIPGSIDPRRVMCPAVISGRYRRLFP